MDFNFLKLYKIPILLGLSCVAFYFTFAYGLERDDFIRLLVLYGAVFYLSFKLIQLQKNNFWFLAGLALVFRIIAIISLPELSQDYFRFIWDGRLIAEGWNPYQFVPDELIKKSSFHIPQATELIEGMGSLSSGNYSNYAPLNQIIFAIAGWLSAKSILGAVMIFRLFIILADVGTLFLGRKLLKLLNLPEHRIFWYILNPFVIIEMTGNLHFEALMVFFLLWSLYLLYRQKWMWSALIFGLSVSVKLLPFIFLPLLFKYFMHKKNSHSEKVEEGLNFKKLIVYYFFVLVTFLLSFIPFYSAEVVSNFLSSVGLWFGKFEFNASIYYVVRWFGYQSKGYNIIESAGPAMGIVTFLLIMILAFCRKYRNLKQLMTTMLFAATIYLFFSTTVHPWYLAIPLILSIFTEFKYLIVWTALVILSYYAYSNPGFQENLWLVALEYLLVSGYFIRELVKNN